MNTDAGKKMKLSQWPHGSVWIAGLLVAVLRALPFLRTQLGPTEQDGLTFVPIGYIPKDWMAYAAFIQQVQTPGEIFLANPFTTEPQGGRFILVFHEVLNIIHRVTGMDAFWLLELSRLPLLLLFVGMLWRFLIPILPNERHRVCATWLVLLSGGIDYLLLLAAPLLPPNIASLVRQEFWALYGWNTFEVAYNPLWLLGLVLVLFVLKPILQPGGPERFRDRFRIWAGFVVLGLTHPYSAIATLVITFSSLGLEWFFTKSFPRISLSRTASALVPALVVLGTISLWQFQDPVFRKSSGGILGPQVGQILWYPFTLGVPGFFAVLGWRRWIAERNPWRWALGGWTLGIAILHSSPVLNGYHFLPYLYLPVCVVAAPVVTKVFGRYRGKPILWLTWVGLLGIFLFSSSLAVTASAVKEAGNHRISIFFRELLDHLGGMPVGNVFCSLDIGNCIPAFTSHRVYVGHWFLTPEADKRARKYDDFVEDPTGRAAELNELLQEQRIAYIIFPTARVPALLMVLGKRVERVITFSDISLVTLTSAQVLQKS